MKNIEHTNHLKNTFAKTEDQTLQDRLWLDATLQSFDEILRGSYDKSIEDFADAILYHFAKITQALRGTFFTADIDKELLVATGGYACRPEHLPKKEFYWGEGLVGQAVKTQETLYMNNLPPVSITVDSSLGQVPAVALLIVPLIFNEEAYGAIELVFVEDLPDKFILLSERLSKNIASMLGSIQSNIRTKHLLEVSQEQATHLAAQEEELRQNMEEMTATQEHLEKQVQETNAMKQELLVRDQLLNKIALVSETDLNGTITYANEKFSKVSKYSIEELLGSPHNIVRHPEVSPAVFRKMWDTIQSGKIFKGKFKNQAKDGTTYWVDASVAPVLNDEGVPVRFLAIRFDITDEMEKRAEVQHLLEQSQQQQSDLVTSEEELRQNMEELTAVQTNLEQQMRATERVKAELEARVNLLNKAALMSEADLYGTITYANEKFCEVSGYTLDELLGKPHNIIRHPDTPKEVFKEMWSTIKDGRVFHAKYKNRTKDNDEYWVDATIAPVLDAQGNLIKYIAIRFDITEEMERRNKVQHLLEQSQQQQSDLVNSEEELRQNMEELQAMQANLEGQMEENQEVKAALEARDNLLNKAALVSEADLYGTITYANEKFCKVAQYSLEELVGKPHNIVRHPDTPQEVFKNMWATIQRGKVFNAKYKNQARDGSTYWVDATIAPVLDKNGDPVRYIAIRFDITEEMEAREKLMKQIPHNE
ncbi:PAS domain-containing protein [uncultured Microscilla sp.]|uniref:PAS domain-containing protein n=1 Tax=uncultured Microscilla sp. TaxID=432653 RepID=UPI00261F31E8|nr:PAS domain-containing protein [uncultured Microscilla sp.]